MANKLFWIKKKSTFGIGKDAIKYGDPIKEGSLSEKRLTKFKKAGAIGEIKEAVFVKDGADVAKENEAMKALIEKQKAEIKELKAPKKAKK